MLVCMTSLQLCCGMHGKECSYKDLAKDMLDLRGPDIVKIVHDLRVKPDAQHRHDPAAASHARADRRLTL